MSKTGRQLYNYLHRRLYQGKLNWPQTLDGSSLELHGKIPGLDFASKRIYKTDEESCQKARNLSLKFYQSALIPQTLTKGKFSPDMPFYNIAMQELYYDVNTKEVIGCSMYALWSVPNDFEPFTVDLAEWLNMAGEIANEHSSSFEEAATIWRNYQQMLSLHLYFCQAHKLGKSKVLANVFGYVEDSRRKDGIHTQFCALLIKKALAACDDIHIGSFITINMTNSLDKMGVQAFANFSYKDLIWKHQGEHVFQHLWDKGGISYIDVAHLKRGSK